MYFSRSTFWNFQEVITVHEDSCLVGCVAGLLGERFWIFLSWKVAGSISDGVIGIFHWHNPSIRTMALGLTQPVTEMSTGDISWGVREADVWGWQPYHLHVLIVLKSGTLNLLEPSGPVQACNRIALQEAFTQQHHAIFQKIWISGTAVLITCFYSNANVCWNCEWTQLLWVFCCPWSKHSEGWMCDVLL